MKKTLSLILLALLVILSPVFAGGSSESTSAESNTLSVLLSEEPSSSDGFIASLRKWADETGNTLDLMVIPYDDQLQRFPLMARNNDMPDLIITTRLTRLYPDQFLDLTNYVDISIFEPQALMIIGQDYTSDANYCLPVQFTITNVFYNADAFERAGLTPPTVEDPWTIDEYVEAARALQERGGVRYGMAMDNSRARYDNLMYMYGGSMVKRDGDSFAVNVNCPESVEALTDFCEWNHSVMPLAIWAGGTSDNPADYFKNGDVGIYFSGSWQYSSFVNDITTFDWAVMPSPVGPNGRSAILGGSGVAVPEAGKNRELALEFIRWFYENPDNYAYFLSVDRGLSSLTTVTYTPDDPKQAADYQVLQAEVSNVTEAFNIDESSSWRNYYDNEYRDALRMAVYGDMTPKASLDDFARRLSARSGWSLINQ